MDFKPNIQKLKSKLLLFALTIAIAVAGFVSQPITAKASGTSDIDWSALAAAIVNSTHDNNVGGTTTIQNGVSIERTGYLAYMVNKESGAPTSDAKAFYAGSNWISGSQWIVSSRHGALNGGGGFTAAAPWGKPWIPPSSKGDSVTSLEPQIKEWFRLYGSDFVSNYFEANHSNYVADQEVLVVETIMGLQFSTAGDSSLPPGEAADADIEALGGDIELADNLYSLGFGQLEDEYYEILNSGKLGAADDAASFMQNVRTILKQYLVSYYQQYGTGDAQSRIYHGSPVIGTVPNLLAYDQWNTIVFDSYLNNAAPNAEKIVYTEAGFTAYPGSGKMTDADVQNYGVAMIIIHCTDPAQTTCNEPQQPSPHKPPIESTGHTTIVKSYRTKNMTTGELVDNGTFSTPDLGTQILIENETEYQVIDWKTSTTTNTSISSLSWNPPSIVIQQGKTPTSVTLDPTETCLYLEHQ